MSVRRTAPLFLVLLTLTFVQAACAHPRVLQERHAWSLRGVVVASGDESLEVRHKSGDVVVIHVDEQTVFLEHNHPGARRRLSPGTRVVVEIRSDGSINRAQRVNVSVRTRSPA